MSPWQIRVDTGGTFTDCLARDPAGRLHRVKVLSTGSLRGRVGSLLDARRLAIEHRWAVPDDFVRGFAFRWLDHDGGDPIEVVGFDASASVLELAHAPPPAPAAGAAFELSSGVEAPILATRMVTGTGYGDELPPIDMRLATTRATNALLQRRGADLALFITRGFGDLLRIGDQQRPELFALRIDKPAPLYGAVVEVDERLAADGAVVTPPDPDQVRDAALRLLGKGVRTAAVALLHAYRNPEHERLVAEVLRDLGFEHVSCSAELSPLIKLLPRAETAVVNAFVAAEIEDYLGEIQDNLAGGGLHVLTSAGGLVSAGKCRAKDSLLSGPAGGVAGAVAAARRSGFTRIISFDMGGTSTDVARYDGDFEYQFEHRVGGVGGVRLVAPALAIETVAAGGGSVCGCVQGQLRVGPDSAAARPGPACYGAGGPLTLTDVNLLLGRLHPDRFEIPVSVDAAAHALASVQCGMQLHTGRVPDREALLCGFLDIANQRMGDAIAEVSLRQGYDPRDHALVAFGGAGGQHACAIAAHLGIETVVMPADASLLSATGLAGAVVERFAQRQILAGLADVAAELPAILAELGCTAAAEVHAEGIPESVIEVRRRIVNLRLAGQETSIAVTMGETLDADFAERYQAMYGHRPQGVIEVESVRVVASSPPPPPEQDPVEAGPGERQGSSALTDDLTRCFFDGSWSDVPCFGRSDLPRGSVIVGPALVFDAYSGYVVEPGWAGAIDDAGALVLRRREDRTARPAAHTQLARQELFANRFMSIARQMGRRLERTALSTNVKERLDFSCALLDADGELVAHAPHMPVHLGALGLCVRALRDEVEMKPGDVVMTNHPAFGGSHIPDITVVTPIHDGNGDVLLGYAASRAHHAEIGGVRPGSMPPLATCLAEEGVVIRPCHLVRGGVSHFDRVECLLREAVHPSRAIADNLADLRAAVAANRHGVSALAALAGEHGCAEIAEQMRLLKSRAEVMARAALRRLPDRRYQAEQRLDDGSLIRVCIDPGADRAVIDFAGTAGVHRGNLNATPAVVRSAVLYVLRVLIGETLPLNEGIMGAVDLRIPRGMLDPEFSLDPMKDPAVGGGNVETSQRIVDTLFQALELCACSQGTMNNTLFGTDRFSYYETVCGGSGAGPDFDGTDAVHTHMTNTRITDPEILEHRYPVRLDRFAIRPGSGGPGAHHGGDGVVREITFLEPMSLSILSQHRTEGPYGLHGGGAGKPGTQHIVRADGTTEPLAPIAGTEVAPGDRLVLKTPGGGGWGKIDRE